MEEKNMPAVKKTTKKLDYKKEFPNLYNPSAKESTIIDVPDMKYFMIDGKGDPNTSQEFQDATTCLYGASYTLKMKIIKLKMPTKDYIVPPLEGLWFMHTMSEWTMEDKSKWQWTLMIRIPDFATDDYINKAMEILKETKDPVAFPKLRYETYHEGTCVQILYIGSYDNEGPTIQKMHKFAEDKGYVLSGNHHEIYLGDPRKMKPESLKTVIRQPIKKQK
jgi:hypothetical protein